GWRARWGTRDTRGRVFACCANGSGTAPSATFGRRTPGPTGRCGPRGSKWTDPRTPRRFLPASIGTCGSALPTPARITPPTISTYWQAFFEEAPSKHETYPRSSIVRFRFPARDKMPPVDLTWWDGGLMPARPAGLEPGRRMGDPNGGVLLIGDKGTIVAGCYGESPRLVPESSMKKYKRPRKTLQRIPEGAD